MILIFDQFLLNNLIKVFFLLIKFTINYYKYLMHNFLNNQKKFLTKKI